MADLIKIPWCRTEYQARFDGPNIGFISSDRVRAFESVAAALRPFDLQLANIDIVDVGTPADHKIVYRIPDRGISFEFGAEECKFAKDGSSWSTAAEDGRVLLAAESALLGGSGATIGTCTVTLLMHLQLLARGREEVLSRFIPEPFKGLVANRQAQTHGSHITFLDGEVLLDFSAAYTNGIFLRLTSFFKGHPSQSVLFDKVRADELALFEILNVKEDV